MLTAKNRDQLQNPANLAGVNTAEITRSRTAVAPPNPALPVLGERSIVMSTSVCACVSACLSLTFREHIPGATRPVIAASSLCVLPMSWLGLPLAALRSLCTSGFMDGIMFAHNGQ